MRLGQLARKIGKRSGQIVTFLEERNISINPDSNTRLDEPYVALIMEHFAPEGIAPEPDTVTIATPEVELPSPAPEPIDEIPAPAEVALNEPDTPTEPEVIRAPKAELSGLKVLGKIDLPEPKKKETTAENAGSEENQPAPAERKKFKPKEDRSKQPRKNYVAIHREREAKEEQKKRERDADQKKAARKQFYETKVKVVKPPKLKEEKEPAREQPQELTHQEPKTILKKFMRWLRPEY